MFCNFCFLFNLFRFSSFNFIKLFSLYDKKNFHRENIQRKKQISRKNLRFLYPKDTTKFCEIKFSSISTSPVRFVLNFLVDLKKKKQMKNFHFPIRLCCSSNIVVDLRINAYGSVTVSKISSFPRHQWDSISIRII